jgi:hypothetical protein
VNFVGVLNLILCLAGDFRPASFADDRNAGDPYGFSIVSLTGHKMIIRYKNVADPNPDHCWHTWEKEIMVPNPPWGIP